MDADRVHHAIEELRTAGSVVDGNGVRRSIFPVALHPAKATFLQGWVLREKPVDTIEIGLAYAYSTLHVCEALLINGNPTARSVAIDPNQLTGYASAGLRVLDHAGVADLVEFHPEESQQALPGFIKDGRCFDLAFVDGNHRFDYVFVDLFFLRRLLRKGGVVILDDYDLPGIRKAISFFVSNCGWTVEETMDGNVAVLRTANSADGRDFRFFTDF